MTPRDFCFWLQGYIELAGADGTPVISKEKVECIQKHLKLVFEAKPQVDQSVLGRLTGGIDGTTIC